MDHTPTPYAVETGDTIIGSNGGIVAIAFDAKPAGTLRNKEQENANAAYIVRACNSHEALLATLQTAHAGLCEASAFIPETCMGAVASCDRAIAAVNTALQSARGDA